MTQSDGLLRDFAAMHPRGRGPASPTGGMISGQSRNELAEPDIVPVDILRAEFATTVRLVAQPVIDFCASPYKFFIKSFDVVNPEITYPKARWTQSSAERCVYDRQSV
jgi:hypothetical protein